jgi:hypothetical protein
MDYPALGCVAPELVNAILHVRLRPVRGLSGSNAFVEHNVTVRNDAVSFEGSRHRVLLLRRVGVVESRGVVYESVRA